MAALGVMVALLALLRAFPMPPRRIADQPLAARTATAQSHNVGALEHAFGGASSAGAERLPRGFAPQRTDLFKLMFRCSKNRHTALRLPGMLFSAWPQRFHLT
jgi:hypothetical protein